MSAPPFKARALRESDESLLASFACSIGEFWCDEVESFICSQLFYWVNAPGAQEDDPRCLLVFDDKNRLAAVAAHELRQRAVVGTTDRAYIRWLQVVAVERDRQGKSFSDGTRVSDVIMSAALNDMTSRSEAGTQVFARVSELNVASSRLCARYGFADRGVDPSHPGYLLLERHLNG